MNGRVQTHDKKGDHPNAAPSRPGTGKDTTPTREASLNPYVEALQTMEKMSRARQVLSTLKGSPARKGLGSQIDLKA